MRFIAILFCSYDCVVLERVFRLDADLVSHGRYESVHAVPKLSIQEGPVGDLSMSNFDDQCRERTGSFLDGWRRDEP